MPTRAERLVLELAEIGLHPDLAVFDGRDAAAGDRRECDYCQKPERIVKCGNDVNGLKTVDGIVFPDAHPGNPVQALRDLNPSVVMKEGKITVIADLDPFSEANGYNPRGASRYSKEFQAKYYAAQSKAMSDRLAGAVGSVTVKLPEVVSQRM